MRELLHAAGSLAAGGVAGYLASGSVAFGVISGSFSLLYYARVYMQGYYFDTCYKGDGTDLAGVEDGFWSLEVEFLKFVFFVLRVGFILVRRIY